MPSHQRRPTASQRASWAAFSPATHSAPPPTWPGCSPKCIARTCPFAQLQVYCGGRGQMRGDPQLTAKPRLLAAAALRKAAALPPGGSGVCVRAWEWFWRRTPLWGMVTAWARHEMTSSTHCRATGPSTPPGERESACVPSSDDRSGNGALVVSPAWLRRRWAKLPRNCLQATWTSPTDP